MRKLYHRLLAFAAVTPLAMTGVASAAVDDVALAVEKAWVEAVSHGTLESYAVFALDFPESSFAREARIRLMQEVTSDDISGILATLVEESDDGRASAPEFIPNSIMVV